ncbi:MAG TPA: MFS transporter [Longimicrobiaceae bacterium]
MQPAGSQSPRQTVRELRVFLTIWAGQLVSALGTGLTAFAVAVVVFQKTGSASQFGLLIFAWMFPMLVLSPVAGTLVDRWDRRRVLIAADTGSALLTFATAALVLSGRFEVWYLFVTSALGSAIGAFQDPAFTAAVAAIVPRHQYGRAVGLLQLLQPASMVVAPLLAGALLASVGLGGIMVIDAATYLAAIAGLLPVAIPSPQRAEAPEEAGGGPVWLAAARRFVGEAVVGWRFVRERRGLLGLLLFVALVNFWAGFVNPLMAPMLLSFGTPVQLAAAQAAVGVGAVLGGVAVGAWGGPRRRVAGIVGSVLVAGACISASGLRASVPLIVATLFLWALVTPLLTTGSSAIWMSKTPQELMGRVLAVRRMALLSMMPLAVLLAGPLADRVFEPLMAPGGTLAGSAGAVIGVGKGRGVALMFVLLGALVMLTAAVAWLVPGIRHVERDVPDAPHPQHPRQQPAPAPGEAAGELAAAG